MKFWIPSSSCQCYLVSLKTEFLLLKPFLSIELIVFNSRTSLYRVCYIYASSKRKSAHDLFWCNEYVEGLKHKFLSASFSNNTKNPITFTHQHRLLAYVYVWVLFISVSYFTNICFTIMMGGLLTSFLTGIVYDLVKRLFKGKLLCSICKCMLEYIV